MSIHFCNEDIPMPRLPKNKLKKWINEAVILESHQLGTVTFIFCSDQYLLEVNRKYLQHDYFTDVITFDYTKAKLISGDIFISCDRVKENASAYKSSFEHELYRIIIHGILHLAGYKDKTKLDKTRMTSKEDFYLDLYLNN